MTSLTRWVARRNLRLYARSGGGRRRAGAGEPVLPGAAPQAPEHMPSLEEMFAMLHHVPSRMRFRARCVLVRGTPGYIHTNREQLRAEARFTRRHGDGRERKGAK